MRFSGKTVIVAVSGSIAAYKALELCRQLKKEGAQIHVILSDGARNFVQPLSFTAISGNDVMENQFDTHGKAGMKHIDLNSADALIIAPATANVVAKAAAGLADDLLTTTLQAFSGPVIIAPAMNDVMYTHQVQHQNIRKLKKMGYSVVEPDAGDLACGRVGQGRLAATDKIVGRLELVLRPHDLDGIRILVTAGPTREYIDPVRFISNASSGKMGYAIAEAAALRGAKVILVSGPSALQPPIGVKTIQVETTKQMEHAIRKNFPNAQIFISAAAPADFAPVTKAKTKIPKNKIKALRLEATSDILGWAGKSKKKTQTVIGFALETDPTIAKARQKRISKNADAILLNGLDNVGLDLASGTLVFTKGQTKFPKADKQRFAHALLDAIRIHASD